MNDVFDLSQSQESAPRSPQRTRKRTKARLVKSKRKKQRSRLDFLSANEAADVEEVDGCDGDGQALGAYPILDLSELRIGRKSLTEREGAYRVKLSPDTYVFEQRAPGHVEFSEIIRLRYENVVSHMHRPSRYLLIEPTCKSRESMSIFAAGHDAQDDFDPTSRRHKGFFHLRTKSEIEKGAITRLFRFLARPDQSPAFFASIVREYDNNSLRALSAESETQNKDNEFMIELSGSDSDDQSPLIPQQCRSSGNLIAKHKDAPKVDHARLTALQRARKCTNARQKKIISSNAHGLSVFARLKPSRSEAENWPSSRTIGSSTRKRLSGPRLTSPAPSSKSAKTTKTSKSLKASKKPKDSKKQSSFFSKLMGGAKAITERAVSLVRRSAEEPPPLRTSPRRTRSSPREPVDVDCHELYMTWPLNEPSRIDISRGDYNRLTEGEFLNDNNIDFYIRLLKRRTDEAILNRTHIFNCFFYKRLTGSSGSLTDRYNTVRKWTKNTDLFKKDFIVIPINECAHWTLAIVCYPSHMNASEFEQRGGKVESSDIKVVEGKDQQPCILLFDSLGAPPTQASRSIRKYLEMEWRDKHDNNEEKAFTASTLPFIKLKVPEQDNSCDCGVFLLLYLEKFLEQMDMFSSTKDDVKERFADWFPLKEVKGKRAQMQEIMEQCRREYLNDKKKAAKQAPQREEANDSSGEDCIVVETKSPPKPNSRKRRNVDEDFVPDNTHSKSKTRGRGRRRRRLRRMALSELENEDKSDAGGDSESVKNSPSMDTKSSDCEDVNAEHSKALDAPSTDSKTMFDGVEQQMEEDLSLLHMDVAAGSDPPTPKEPEEEVDLTLIAPTADDTGQGNSNGHASKSLKTFANFKRNASSSMLESQSLVDDDEYDS